MFFSCRAMTASTCCPMACAWEGVQRSVGPSAFIWVSREEGETERGVEVVIGGGWEGWEVGWEVGGEGVPVWEAEGLGEGSSTFTWEMLPMSGGSCIHVHCALH